MIKLMLIGIAMLALFLPATAHAQVAPSSDQRAAYDGLFQAAQADDAGTIAKLLSDGADINARDAHGRTPLMVAAFNSSDSAAAALMDAGADSALLEHDRYDAVTIASVENDAEMVRLLITKGARADLVTSIYDGTALIAAAHLGHVEVVRELIRGKAPLDHVNNLAWTALIEAIVLGDGGPRHTQVVRDLVQAGADVTIPDRQGRTPLSLAQGRGYAEMVEILKAAGAR